VAPGPLHADITPPRDAPAPAVSAPGSGGDPFAVGVALAPPPAALVSSPVSFRPQPLAPEDLVPPARVDASPERRPDGESAAEPAPDRDSSEVRSPAGPASDEVSTDEAPVAAGHGDPAAVPSAATGTTELSPPGDPVALLPLESSADGAPAAVGPGGTGLPGTTLVASTIPGTVPGTVAPLRPTVPAPGVGHRHRPGRRAWRALWVLAALVVAGAGTVVVVQLRRPLPAPTLHHTYVLSTTVAGTPPALPWPTAGEAAVAVPALGLDVASGPEPPVPVASLAKIMTAYLTLRDHPLAPGAQGPSVTMTATDEEEAIAEDGQGATNVPVRPGEQLSERQLLDGLMVHSANNFADALARWDAGSVPAFVAEMNSAAAALGMTHTHYADTDGLSTATTGTPADQLLVTQAAMAIPAFAAVVDQTSVTLPIVGQLPNYVSAVGTDGVVGVKSGFTQAAMGCLVLAADRSVAGRPVLVLAAVTGQTGADPLSAADDVDLRLVDAVAAGLRPLNVIGAGTRVGTVTTAWDVNGVAADTTAGVTLLVWPGMDLRATVSHEPLAVGTSAGAHIDTVTVLAGSERARVPVRLAGSLRGPPLGWRLTRG